jgi:hypothetical protein
VSGVSVHNVELHRRLNAAFNARDLEAVIASCDPRMEWRSILAEVGAVYHGHAEIRRWYAEAIDVWREMRLELDAYFDLGEHTVASGTIHGRGQRSDAVVVTPFATVARWRDGLCVYAGMHHDREAALRELHVSEDELEPLAP